MNLKKIYKNVLSLLLFCMISLSPINIFANQTEAYDSEVHNLLTFEEAVNKAINESTDLKNLKLENESTSVKIDDGLENFGTSLMNPELLAVIKLQKNDKLNSDKTQRMENYIKRGIEFKIKSIFSNINIMKNDLALKNEQLNNSIRKRDMLELKLEYGMESKTNLTTMDIEINQSRKDIETLEKELEEQYIQLNQLIGSDRFDRYEIESLAFNFEPIKDTSEDIEFKANRAISSDISIWGKKQQLEIQRIDIDFYALNYIPGAPSSMQPGSSSPYKALELDSSIASNDLEQAKKDLKDAVIGKYNTIKKIELMYENTLLKTKELEEKKRVLEVAIKSGTAIKQDYDDLMLGLKEVDNAIDKIQAQHALLVEMYNDPLLVGSNMS